MAARPFLVAPDSFKGTLSAAEVADALARGLRRAGAAVDRCPLADGGEGTLDALAPALGAVRVSASAHDPLGRPIEAQYGWAAASATAIVETAAASGLGRVTERERDAWAASSAGTGELIAAAAAGGARTILLAAGGSATTDGGAGALAALAQADEHALVDAPAPAAAIGGADALAAVPAGGGAPGADRAAGERAPDAATLAAADRVLRGARLVVLCDVRTPFERAAATFAPQKGADAATARALAARLDALAVRLPRDPRGVPLSGAAGGLAGGLWAALGATLVPGAAWILDALDVEQRLRGACAAITGEGSLDAQTAEGKLVAELARRARAAGVPVHAVVGRNALAPDAIRALGLATVTEAGTPAALEAAGETLAGYDNRRCSA